MKKYQLTQEGEEVQALLDKVEGLKANQTPGEGVVPVPLESLSLEGVLYSVVTKAVSDLLNYYTKNETYTKSEVNTMVAAIKQFTIRSVDVLPQPSADTMNILFLVPAEEPKVENEKDEFISVIKGAAYAWEKVGSTAIDLSDYVTIEDLNTALAGYVTSGALATALAGLHDVKYTAQALSDEQKEQARTNIGAGTYSKPGTGVPKTDMAIDVQTSLGKADTAVQPSALVPIEEVIPDQASANNKLADKAFVNSSIATNTANYISDNGQPFQSLSDLQAYSGTLTNNDYAFVVGTDSAGNTTYTRYKYNATTAQWAEEYVLNNSSFTAEQWAAISSGITALLVQKLSDLPTEIVTYVNQTLTEAQKQQARTNIGATAPEIFWAEYNVTLYSDIVNEVNSGKVVALLYGGRVYIISQTNFLDSVWFIADAGTHVFRIRCTNTNRWTQDTVYVEITANKSQSVPNDLTNTTKYPSVKAVADALGKWGVVSQTQTWTGSDETGYDYTMSNQVYGLIPQANIDLYVAAGAVFNETTGYFELNGLTDISYEEMLRIYNETVGLVPVLASKSTALTLYPHRTTLALKETASFAANNSYLCYGAINLVVIAFQGTLLTTAANLSGIFRSCRSLRRVIGQIRIASGTGEIKPCVGCFSLQDIEIYNLLGNLELSDSSLLELDSVVFAVKNAANTTAITITLHATAYARCQADTTEYTYQGNTYVGILAYASAKNITIASA